MANIKETSGVMGYVDEQGNPSIHYPVTKAENVEGLDDAIKEQFTGGVISPNDIGAAASNHTHTPSSIGAAASSHNHDASAINSGTLDSSRLPTVPFSKGGTGQTTGAKGLYALVNAASALNNTTIATDDFFALLDASGSTGAKITLANLLAYLRSNISAGAKTYVYTFTASNWSNGTLTIAAATHGITGNGITATFYHNLSGTYTAGTWACIESWAYIDPSTHVITLHGPTNGYAGKVVLIG